MPDTRERIGEGPRDGPALSPRVWIAAAALGIAAIVGFVRVAGGLDREPLEPTRAPLVSTLDDVAALPASVDGLALPNRDDSLRFAVLGDVGRGGELQYETAARLTRWHAVFPFEFALLLGDNNYGAGTPEEYERRFERPYRALLDAGVRFHAALGNHDPPGQTDYPLYNMGGNRYYRFTRRFGAVLPMDRTTAEFIALDTVTLDERQLAWLRRTLSESDADWKIAFYHHPLYTSGRYRTTAGRTRRLLEPIFVAGGLDVGLSGHEHLYERLHPQLGVLYFTSGAGGTVRVGDVAPTPRTAAAFDDDTHFLLVEISRDTLFFQAVARTGRTVDAGRLERGAPSAEPPR